MKGIKIAVIVGAFYVTMTFFVFIFFSLLFGGKIEEEKGELGTGGGNDIVQVALAEVTDENDGGEKFWSYMGFTEHEEWCASFVSWCGYQCGYYDYDDVSIMPRSALCEDFRIFYKEIERWRDGQAHGGSYVPHRGDFILFQWEGKPEEKVEHIGIVVDCDGTVVTTVEGNSNDKVQCNTYSLSNQNIIGYCVPEYPGGVLGTGGHSVDGTNYTTDEINLIYAIVQQEDGGSYEGALAVISTAMNRVDSSEWGFCGRNALDQLKAPGQFCYSIDENWKQWLGGNVKYYVKQAVDDCLKEGIRNHDYTSFRSNQGSHTGGEYIPDESGNYYFN